MSPTPPNVIAAPSQNAFDSCSSLRTTVSSAMKTGVAPSRSETVDACASLSAYTKHSWLRKSESAATSTSGRSARAMRKERSRRYVKIQNSEVAAK